MNQSESIDQLLGALLVARSEFPCITKNQEAVISGEKGTYTYEYADLPQILAAVVPVLSQHGLMLLSTLDPTEDGRIIINTRLYHLSTQFLASTLILDKPKTMKGFGADVSYVRRYAAQAMLNISAGEDNEHQVDAGSDGTSARRSGTPAGPGTKSSKATISAPAVTPALKELGASETHSQQIPVAAPGLTIPADLPCPGAKVEDLRPSQLVLLLGKVEYLWSTTHDEKWTPILQALTAEQAKRAGKPTVEASVNQEGSDPVQSEEDVGESGPVSDEQLTKLIEVATAAKSRDDFDVHIRRELGVAPDVRVTKKMLLSLLTIGPYQRAMERYTTLLRERVEGDVPDFPPKQESADGSLPPAGQPDASENLPPSEASDPADTGGSGGQDWQQYATSAELFHLKQLARQVDAKALADVEEIIMKAGQDPGTGQGSVAKALGCPVEWKGAITGGRVTS